MISMPKPIPSNRPGKAGAIKTAAPVVVNPDVFFGADRKKGTGRLRNWVLATVLGASLGGAQAAKVQAQEESPNTQTVETKSNASVSLSSDALAKSLLDDRPFPIAVRRLYEAAYTGVFPPSPSTPVVSTDAQAIQLLKTYAARDPFAKPGPVLAVFNNPVLRAKAPEPTIRAGVAAMAGTPGGDAATDFIINRTNSLGLPKVAFLVYADAPLPSGVNIVALYNRSTGQVAYVIRPDFKNENPLLLRPLLKHEVLHQDGSAGLYEEAQAFTYQAMDSLLLLQYHPHLAQLNTHLAQTNRLYAAALTNSRPLTGHNAAMGILAQGQERLFKDSRVEATNFLELLASSFSAESSPGNPEQQFYQTEFLGPSTRLCPQEFTAESLRCLDEAIAESSMHSSSLFSPLNRVWQALTLRLNPFAGLFARLSAGLNDKLVNEAEESYALMGSQEITENNEAHQLAGGKSLDALKAEGWQVIHLEQYGAVQSRVP